MSERCDDELKEPEIATRNVEAREERFFCSLVVPVAFWLQLERSYGILKAPMHVASYVHTLSNFRNDRRAKKKYGNKKKLS